MRYGPFHTLRCKDEIAAAMLDERDDASDDERGPSTAVDAEPPTADLDAAPETTPAFLADDATDATPLTGPAEDDGATER
jgi:hypothetical protein